MQDKKTGLFWFTNDIRLHDNPALMRANLLVDELLCVYIIDCPWRISNQYSQANISVNPDRFLHESLLELSNNLTKIGQNLLVVKANTSQALTRLLSQYQVTDIFRSDNVGWYENRVWHDAAQANVTIRFHSVDSHTLFDSNLLPFTIDELPNTFTKFKKTVSEIATHKPIAAITQLPPPPETPPIDIVTLSLTAHATKTSKSGFSGGERAGLAQLNHYFSSDKPSFYKVVRNSIDGWDNSSKFSPWLANGCLSVRTVRSRISEYEANIIANESTYWLYFELLWREYFQWYALKYGARLFSFIGIKKLSPLTSYYPERFKKWTNGTTPYPLVNACMNQLTATGYLSNRGRQIVASCFVNELAMDWRYGAAYFEQTLIDYDVASNWGNWQYLAGVGADARDKRHFNLEKQTQQFDPEGDYIERWGGLRDQTPLDSVDAADWPIS